MADGINKVVLVTGSSRGIGRGIALELAKAGYDVMLTARDAAALRGVADEIRALGRKVAIHTADLTASTGPANLVQATVREFGQLDVLINNAGANKRGNFLELTEQDWSNSFDLKFFAHMRLCREAWPHLKSTQGSIIFIAGLGARSPVDDYTIGAAVVGASLSFMKALADFGKNEGVQVNAINPGSVRTDRFRHRLGLVMGKTGLGESEAIEHHRLELGITRFGRPEDIAGLVSFVVSPRGRWLQGSAIDMDGGQIEPLRMARYE